MLLTRVRDSPHIDLARVDASRGVRVSSPPSSLRTISSTTVHDSSPLGPLTVTVWPSSFKVTPLGIATGFFRMRAIMSPMGSLTMSIPSSPARLDQTGNLSGRAKLAQRDAAHLHLAIEGARTAGHQTTIANPPGRRVARQLGELEPRVEPFL